MTEVYLVGDHNSLLNNQWLAMTNCIVEADKLAAEIKGGASRKTIEVKPPFVRKRTKRGK